MSRRSLGLLLGLLSARALIMGSYKCIYKYCLVLSREWGMDPHSTPI